MKLIKIIGEILPNLVKEKEATYEDNFEVAGNVLKF